LKGAANPNTRVKSNTKENSKMELLNILIKRDKISKEEALELINDAKLRVLDGEDPEEILHDEFGLEPDYIFDLID
jgi:sulfur relay (sulfurtransferase) DsrF/TusC family protein